MYIFEATNVRAFTDQYWVFNWTSFDFYGSRLSDERFLPAGERNTIVASFADPNQTLASIKKETSETFKITALLFLVSWSTRMKAWKPESDTVAADVTYPEMC